MTAVVASGIAGCLDTDRVRVRGFTTLWKTDNGGSTAHDMIRLPLLESGSYNLEVDWGDGTSDSIDAYDDEAVTHQYDEPGEYEVTIDGELHGWSFQETVASSWSPCAVQSGDAQKLVEIRNWGGFDVGLGESSGTSYWDKPRANFSNAENLTVTAVDEPEVGADANFRSLFQCTAVADEIRLHNWDVSNVENMEGLFMGAVAFDGDVGGWDVSNVEVMQDLFLGAESFNGDVGNWDVSSVRSMANMFASATSFTGDLSEWDVSNVRRMSNMFTGAKSFDGDISDWNVSRVRSMKNMFAGAISFDGDISDWDVSNVENMSEMFAGAESFDGDVSEWDVSNVERMNRMFYESGLTTENYDAILVEWQELDLEADVAFGAGDTQYSPGEPAEARQHIVEEYGWDISDGGLTD